MSDCMMAEPLVTVIIPTFKRTVKYLSRAVNSVLNQTYSNVEIIVIDDSPENFVYRNEIKSYMETIANHRLRYYQNERNLGGSMARNRGINLANGAYITFLDDDDEYKPRKIEEQIHFMLQGDFDLSFTDMIMYNTSGRVVDYRDYKDILGFDNDTLLRYHLMRHMTGTPTFMFKTLKLREIGSFEDKKMGQEFYLMLKSIERGLKIGYLPVCNVIVYKHSDGGISQGKNKINGEAQLYEFKKKYFDILNDKEINYINFRHWAVMAIAYKRNQMYLSMITSIIKAMVSSPGDFIKEIITFSKKILHNNTILKGATEENAI